LGIANICDLLPISTDVTYNHLLGRNPYISKRPRRQRCAFPLALLSSALVGVLLALVEGLGWTILRGTVDFLTPRSWDCAHSTRRARFQFPFYCHFMLMAPIPPSRCRVYQFRAEELNDFLEIVESYLLLSTQNWQAVADIHLENYRREAQTVKMWGDKWWLLPSYAGWCLRLIELGVGALERIS